MKYQTNPELGKAINHWGCHFMSILQKVEERCSVKFSNDDVVTVFKMCVKNGNVQGEVIDNNGDIVDGCLVYNGAAIFNLGAMFKSSPVRCRDYRRESKTYVPKSNEVEILQLKRAGYEGSHFVSGTGISNANMWQSEILFDPIEGGSNCARTGWIESKRILVF